MKDLIDTVLEQIEVGDCIVFCSHCDCNTYQSAVYNRNRCKVYEGGCD